MVDIECAPGYRYEDMNIEELDIMWLSYKWLITNCQSVDIFWMLILDSEWLDGCSKICTAKTCLTSGWVSSGLAGYRFWISSACNRDLRCCFCICNELVRRLIMLNISSLQFQLNDNSYPETKIFESFEDYFLGFQYCYFCKMFSSNMNRFCSL